MKTPRQILLEQHQSVESKLDAVRQKALANLAPIQTEKALTFRQVFQSFRWHLAGMSAAWLLVALLNIDHSHTFTASINTRNIPSPQRLMAAIRENRRQLLKILEPPIKDPIGVPHARIPKKRNELEPENSVT